MVSVINCLIFILNLISAIIIYWKPTVPKWLSLFKIITVKIPARDCSNKIKVIYTFTIKMSLTLILKMKTLISIYDVICKFVLEV